MNCTEIEKCRNIDLINDLLNVNENAIVEFKKDNIDPQKIGILCSALSNAACLHSQSFGYILWGIDDKSNQVIGTQFNPDKEQNNNQIFALQLTKKLKPNTALNFKKIDHPNGRVVLLEIPATTMTPTFFDNIAYIRIGSATPKLTDFPEIHKKLIERLRPYTWEHGTAKQYCLSDDVLRLLDYSAYLTLTKQPVPDNRSAILEKLAADQLITKDVGEKWNISNLGAILFANNLSDFSISLARKGVRFIAYSGKNKASQVTHRVEGSKGYALGFKGLIEYIDNLQPKNEHIRHALRETHSLFPEIAIRELIANALIHQNMSITGTGPQIELFEDRIEIVNPGAPLMSPERMIDLPPRSRNESLAALMRRMGMCEEQGSGLDKVIDAVEFSQLPAPLFKANDDSTQVILYAPRPFANMTPDERVRACYQHAILKFISGARMKNATLCKRFGIEKNNAAQATKVIKQAMEANLIKPADTMHPRAGYLPAWT